MSNDPNDLVWNFGDWDLFVIWYLRFVALNGEGMLS